MEKLLRAFASEQLQVEEITEIRSPKRIRLLEESDKLHTELSLFDRKEKYENLSLDFLGYTFRPRHVKNRYGKFFTSC